MLALYSDDRVRILLKPEVFSVKFEFEKNENKQKEARVGPFLKHASLCALLVIH